MKRTIFLCLLIFIPSVALAANSTTIGTLSLYQTFESIGVRCSYSGDDNKNMTATVEYQKSGGNWVAAHDPVVLNSGGKFDHQVVTSLFELSKGTGYNVRVLFNDPDGVSGTNPVTGSSVTWSHDRPDVGSACNDTATSWSELSSALSACSGSTGTITLTKSGDYSGGADRTISTNGSGLNGFIKIVAGSGVTAYFADQVTVTGDYLWFDNVEFRNSNYSGTNSEHGLVPNGAKYNVYTDCKFLKNIYLTGDLVGTLFDGNTVTSGCIDDGDCTKDPPGPGGNNCFQNNSLNSTRNGIVIQNNEIYGCRDGIGDWTTWSEVDIKGNNFYDCFDEAMEIEGGNVNVRIWNNYTYNGSRVEPRASLAVAEGGFYGPMFVWNNIFTMAGSNFYHIKNGKNTSGPYLYYNTFYTNVGGVRILQDASGDGAFFTGKNNIFRNTTGYWFQADGCGGWLDYNNFDTSNTKSSEKVKWRYGGSSMCSGSQRTYDSLNAFESASEVGNNNIAVDSDLDGSFRPKSSVLNRGIPIQGLTKDKDGNLRASSNPTIGAYEYGGQVPPPDPDPDPEPEPEPASVDPPSNVIIYPVGLYVASVRASTDDGNVAGNTLDTDISTRWSGYGVGAWIEFDLGSIQVVSRAYISFFNGNQRTADFSIEISQNGTNWTEVFDGRSSGNTLIQEQFNFTSAISARYVRIVGKGNSSNDWNSITEVDIF